MRPPSRRGAACLLLTAQLSGVRAFAVMTSEPARGLGSAWRWPSPADAASDEGLGGGLFYAIEETFCDSLLPTFVDDLLPDARVLVTCAQLKGAIASAFSTWGQNHKRIHFVDAGSERCVPSAAEGVLQGNETVHDVAAARGCIEPDIILHAPSSAADSWAGVQVEKVAVTILTIFDKGGVWLTDGTWSEHGHRIANAQIDFNNNTCWYLDGGFCQGLHQWDTVTRGGTFNLATLLFQLAWGGTLCCTLMRAIWVLCLSSTAVFPTSPCVIFSAWLAKRRAAPGGRREDRLAQAHPTTRALPWASFVVIVLAIVYPPLFWSRVLLPCFDCSSFQAALMHEIGHVLGLQHPDKPADETLILRTSSAKGARTGGCASSAVRYEPTDDPQTARATMQALAKSGVGCLWQDDLDGLNALYPLCSSVVRQEPRCLRLEQNTGWLRVMIVLIVPLAVLLIFSLALSLLIARRRRAQAGSWPPSVGAGFISKHEKRLSTDTLVSGSSSSLSASFSSGPHYSVIGNVLPLSGTPPSPINASDISVPISVELAEFQSLAPRVLRLLRGSWARDAGGAAQDAPPQLATPVAFPSATELSAGGASGAADEPLWRVALTELSTRAIEPGVLESSWLTRLA
ncbi:hypothetical protein T492DRAFT_1129452 [Pavlovales sp. CCMP2436]|nr:hypothetical protein T492DRAFT_1129452 [Pavlovales sp. CCMP2436]